MILPYPISDAPLVQAPNADTMKTAAITLTSRWLLTTVTLLSLTLSSHADTFGLFTYVDQGASVKITDYPNDAVGVVVVPTTIAGKPVTVIGNSAFESCQSITGITLPVGLLSVEANAFSGCNGLSTILIPSTVTTIDDHAFLNCEF